MWPAQHSPKPEVREEEGEHILPLQQTVRLVTQIAAALQVAHSQGLVHRDVKPENILLDAQGVAYLTDFGIAREAAALRRSDTKRTLSPSGLPVGTPEYMSPEQLQGDNVDLRADVYALGAVYYELMTGTTPHAAATPYAVAIRTLTEAPIPPSQLNPAVSPQLESVVLRTLAINPDDRYQDMKSFAEALIAASSGPAFSPESPSPTAVTIPVPAPTFLSGIDLRRIPTKYRRTAAAVLIGLLLLAGGGILLGSQGHHSSVPGLSPGNVSNETNSRSASSKATPTTASSGTIPRTSDPTPNLTASVTPAQATATADATGTPDPRTTPTVGSQLTPTPVSTPPTPTPTAATPTPTPVPVMLLQLNPASQITLSKQAQTCAGSQVITNPNAFDVSWQWTDASPNITGLRYKTTGSTWSSGLPSSVLSANGSTTLSITLNCGNGQHNSITMSDNQEHTYSFTLQVS